MSVCPDLAVLDEFAGGSTAGTPMFREVEVHLSECPECRAACDDLRRNQRLLGPLQSALGGQQRLLASSVALLGTRVGRYEIRGILGRGGMATVYRAVQDHPCREVALKVMKYDFPAGPATRRFEHEIEILGRLRHPGIAQIYEAGMAEIGFDTQPFFAMELIEGRTLTEYAQAGKLPVAQRLDLFIRVCEAIEYAHQRGVIHRDLKPSNILVDTSGQPKVLDFGVARATGADMQVETQFTESGRLLGTIPFMSPEQAAGDSGEIDTRSDIYALGLVLYGLLTGHMPYDVLDKPAPEAFRIIRDESPLPLSAIDTRLKGDLETIAAKTLEKDKSRRYASASLLAGDIRHYLNHEPIAARPPTAAYQLRKFARRHKAAVVGTVAVFVSLVTGLIGIGVEYARATDQRNRARRAEEVAEMRRMEADAQRIKAEHTLSLWDEALSASNPTRRKGADYTMRQFLDDFSKRLGDQPRDQPEIEARLRTTMGRSYRALGLYAAADEQYQMALELRRQAFGDKDLGVAEILSSRAWTFHFRRKLNEAKRLFESALSIQLELLGEEHLEVASTLNGLSMIQRQIGELAEAESLARRTLGIRQRLLGVDHVDVTSSLLTLGQALRDQGRYPEAMPFLQEVVSRYKSAYGEVDPHTMDGLIHLGLLLHEMGDDEGAITEHDAALAIAQEIYGEHHSLTGECLNNLAVALTNQPDRRAEAESLLRRSLAIHQEVIGEDATQNLKIATTVGNLARNLMLQGRAEEAEPLFAQAVVGIRLNQRVGSPRVGKILLDYGKCLFTLQRYQDAEQALLEARDILNLQPGHSLNRTTCATKALVGLYEAWDRPEDAARFRAMLAEPGSSGEVLNAGLP